MTLLFLLMVCGGMTGAFFLILTKNNTWAYVVILLTVFLSFFSTVGWRMLEKTQIERAELYLKDKSEKFNSELKKLNS